MPASVRLILILLVASAVAAAASVYVLHAQDVQQARVNAEAMTGGDYDRGKAALALFHCDACHSVPGDAHLTGQVGPALAGVASRATIAGHLANRPDQMIFWLQHPQQVAPGSGMPDQRVTERDARDIAAYLYTFRTTSY